MRNSNYLHSDLSGQILKAYYEVYNNLGYGFLEKVYENALKNELESLGLHVAQQQKINVSYKGKTVGDYYCDLLVEGVIIIELKAAKKLSKKHEAQLINYLRATNIEVGLLLNFGRKPEFKRKVLTAEYK